MATYQLIHEINTLDKQTYGMVIAIASSAGRPEKVFRTDPIRGQTRGL
jgi:hypothetical protein